MSPVHQQDLPRLRHPRLWFGLGYLALAIIAFVSLTPMPNVGVSDKLLHFSTYAALAAGYATLLRNWRQLLLVAVGLMAYGVLIEFLQGMTSYRTYDVHDMLANSLGVLIGSIVWLTPWPKWFRRMEAGPHRPPQ